MVSRGCSDYNDRDSFSRTWTFASEDERWLLSIRQGAAIYATMWAMEAAEVAFHEVSSEQAWRANPETHPPEDTTQTFIENLVSFR
jgi:hypothetical protein